MAGRPPEPARTTSPVTGWSSVDLLGRLFGLFPTRDAADRVAAGLGGAAAGAIARDATATDVPSGVPADPPTDRTSH